jgi:hypothetical protein
MVQCLALVSTEIRFHKNEKYLDQIKDPAPWSYSELQRLNEMEGYDHE